MIKAKLLKDWANSLTDEALVGIDDRCLVAREPESMGLEEELGVGLLPPVEEDYE